MNQFSNPDELHDKTREYFLNVISEAHQREVEFGMAGVDLNELRVAVMADDSEAVLVPTRDQFNHPCHILVLRDANALAKWNSVAGPKEWLEFEGELKGRLEDANVRTS